MADHLHRRRRRRRRAILALVLFAAGALGLLLAPLSDDFTILLGLALVVGGVVLTRAVFRPDVTVPAEAFDVPSARRPARHPVVLVNERSGGGKAAEIDLVARCGELGIEAVVLQPGDDLTELAEAAVARGADALGMAGGDGSLGLVAAVALTHDLPFACIPVGTRNHFALDAGLDRADPISALSAFTAGDEHAIDVAFVNDRLFVNNVALGLYATVVANPDYRDAKFDTALASLGTVRDKDDPAFDLEIDVPGAGHWTQAALVLVSNNPYEVRPPRAMGRRLRLDGGTLGIAAVDVDSVGSIAALTALAALQSSERSRSLWTWSETTLRVDSRHRSVPAGIDGEAVELTPPLLFRAAPRALRLLVPPGAPVGLECQDPSTTSGTMAGLLDVILTGDDDIEGERRAT